MIIVKSIVYKPAEKPTQKAGYWRQSLREADLVEGYGIEGDLKGGNPNRNLNVMDDITQTELAAQGYPTGPGVLGENIILAGVDLRTLPDGMQLRIGPHAAIELIKPRNGCKQLTLLDARMPDSVGGRVGVMCSVVQSGHIKVGDPVELMAQAVPS